MLNVLQKLKYNNKHISENNKDIKRISTDLNLRGPEVQYSIQNYQ